MKDARCCSLCMQCGNDRCTCSKVQLPIMTNGRMDERSDLDVRLIMAVQSVPCMGTGMLVCYCAAVVCVCTCMCCVCVCVLVYVCLLCVCACVCEIKRIMCLTSQKWSGLLPDMNQTWARHEPDVSQKWAVVLMSFTLHCTQWSDWTMCWYCLQMHSHTTLVYS